MAGCASVLAERGPVPPAGAPAAQDRADLLHCLAAAFLPPPGTLPASQWCESLSTDLAQIGPVLALDAGDACAALHAVQAEDPWLVEYSRLFLVPPVRVTLNAGVYLEGGLAGVSARMMEECYSRAGLARREGFGDLPDHVAMQLEFLATLVDRAAEGDADASGLAAEFCRDFVAHWAPALARACDSAAAREELAPTQRRVAAAYGHLARLVDATGRSLAATG